MRADGKVQFASKLPQPIVLRIMQPFAIRKERVSYRHGAKFLHRSARFLDHFPDVGAWKDRDELQTLGINTTAFASPVVVGPAHRGAELEILERNSVCKVAVVARRKNHLDVPP